MSFLFNENAKEISLRAFTKGMEGEAQVLSHYYGERHHRIANDVLLLARESSVRALLDESDGMAAGSAAGAEDSALKLRVASLFQAMLASRPEYMQVRLVGVRNGGKEIVRVNKSPDGAIATTPDIALQNKSEEPYYKLITGHRWSDAQNASDPASRVLYSRITFNRENGRISYPLTYTLRAMYPLFNAKQELDGFVVINTDYGQLLGSAFGGIAKDSNVIVMNNQGDYLTYFSGGEIARLEVNGEYTQPPSGIARMMLTTDQTSGILEGSGSVSYFRTVTVSSEQPDRRIKVAFVQPEATALAKIGGIGIESTLAVALIAALAMLVIIILTSIIMRPLKILQSEVKRASDGEAALRLPTDWKNELGQLAKAFQLLVDKHVQSEVKLGLILDNIGEGILTIDSAGTIVTFNPACEHIFGYPAEEAIGQDVSILMPLRQARHHDRYLTRYQQEGTRRIDWSRRKETGKRSDGTEFPLELTVTELTFEKRRLFVGILRDISERQLAEKAKSEFLATVSHELRTPLTSIRGSLGLLQNASVISDPEKLTKISGLAVKNSERLQDLIDNLLDLERIEDKRLKLNKAPFDLLDLVKEVVSDWRDDQERSGVSFEIASHSTPAVVDGDRKQVRRVLMNLLSNALKFSKKGDTVVIGVVRDAQRQVAHLAVRDQGCGVPEHARETMFEKFAQADSSDKRQQGGTGLGLTIASELIAMHGGTLQYEPVEGGGSNFFFDLPLGDSALNDLLRARREARDIDLP